MDLKSAGTSRPASARLMTISYILYALGLILSLYAWIGRLATERDENYKSACDFSGDLSCSKAFGSRYGRGFGLIDRLLPASSILNQPNGAMYSVYYTAQAVFVSSPSITVSRIQLLASSLSVCLSVYLFYILRYVIHYHCILCYMLHFTSYCTFFCCLYKCWSLHKLKETKIKEN